MGFLYFSNFNIRVLEKNSEEDFFSTKGKCLKTLMSDSRLFSKDPVCILADPFLFERNGVLYLFYEYQKKRYGRGELRMRKTVDLKHWSDEVVVLRENFHLSFPNVFEDGGEVYMIPETGADGSIRLYKALDDSLEKWTLFRTMINDGRTWADSDIFIKDGKYYLFSSIYSRKAPQAHIFVADSLNGSFVEHPCSPFSSDLSNARNAGRIFCYEGKLFRPVQDNTNGYGKQVSIMAIDELSPETYRESLWREHILDKTDAFYKRGGHQFCPIVYKGRLIVATDGKQRNYNIRENLNGYCHHLCKRG